MPRGRREAAPEPRAGVITALVVRSGKPERTRVYLDGRRGFELATDIVERAGLKTGSLLSEETAADLIAEDEPHRARERALRLLSARDRTRLELERRLRIAGFQPATIAATLAWLAGLGYIDDDRYCRRYVAEKLRMGWGQVRIRAELGRKGIDRGLMDACLAETQADGETAASGDNAVLSLLQKRFGRSWQDDRQAAERRMAGFLARRGYDWEAASRLMRAFEASREEVDDSTIVDCTNRRRDAVSE